MWTGWTWRNTWNLTEHGQKSLETTAFVTQGTGSHWGGVIRYESKYLVECTKQVWGTATWAWGSKIMDIWVLQLDSLNQSTIKGRFTLPLPSPKSLEVNPCNLSRWEHGRWKFTTSHGSQVLSLKSIEVNPCNLIRWEHRSWDLPFHTASQVPSPLKSIRAILAVESMEVGIYHFTWSPKSQVNWGQSVQSHPLRAWKLGFAISHGVPSHKSRV
jgi:hypothetical protein